MIGIKIDLQSWLLPTGWKQKAILSNSIGAKHIKSVLDFVVGCAGRNYSLSRVSLFLYKYILSSFKGMSLARDYG